MDRSSSAPTSVCSRSGSGENRSSRRTSGSRWLVALSVRQRVEEDVDTDGVAGGGELVEVPVIVAFTFERIAEIGVVRHEDEHVSLLIADGARVRHGAVGAALRRAAARALPEADRRN